MAPEVTIILGYPGSGKAHLAREFEREAGPRRFEGTAAPEEKNLWSEMMAHLRDGVLAQ